MSRHKKDVVLSFWHSELKQTILTDVKLISISNEQTISCTVGYLSSVVLTDVKCDD